MSKKIDIDYINQLWDSSIIPTLHEYIKIPNKSPAFDPDWEQHQYMEQAVNLLAAWCEQHAADNMQLEIVRLPGRTPIIFIEIDGDKDDTVLLYGHLDKQPEMEGWDNDLGPWQPVLRGDKLYGRGGADDGYSTFAALSAIKALQQQNIPHHRCVIIIEASEESGSFDLPYYIDALASRIGEPTLVVCLDSGCGNYEQLWLTTSLRGNVVGELSVELLQEGVHSGAASGIVASSFRVLRQILSRIEDETSGDILLEALHVDIPIARIEQAQQAAKILGNGLVDGFAFQSNVKPINDNVAELILNSTWRPALAVTGAAGLPSLQDAGNVMRPLTAVKLSMRIPPSCDAEQASHTIKTILEANPPYGAKVHYQANESAQGWDSPPVSAWLHEAVNAASEHYFGKPAVYMGEGGTIPFMAMLGDRFPKAQFMITGVLGPRSNAHGPNEFLHIPSAKKVTACVAHVLANM